MTTKEQPIPLNEPMPHRKVIREWLIPLSHRVTVRALALLLLDFAIWGAFLAGTVYFEAIWAKLLCGVAMGFTIGRLFIIGHDACHQSLTPHRGLNKWVGRIAFLPSLTTFSLWDIGHNVVHHGYTNLKGFDFVWAPLTREEFVKLSWMGRLLDRAYRSGWAPGLYYMIEIWWKKMVFPSAKEMPTRRPHLCERQFAHQRLRLGLGGWHGGRGHCHRPVDCLGFVVQCGGAVFVLVRHDRFCGVCAPHPCQSVLAR
jgi:acyl-lipid omega-6 desaturase (Delta-12 desaturase)